MPVAVRQDHCRRAIAEVDGAAQSYTSVRTLGKSCAWKTSRSSTARSLHCTTSVGQPSLTTSSASSVQTGREKAAALQPSRMRWIVARPSISRQCGRNECPNIRPRGSRTAQDVPAEFVFRGTDRAAECRFGHRQGLFDQSHNVTTHAMARGGYPAPGRTGRRAAA